MKTPQDETKTQQFAEEFSKFPLKKRRFLESFAKTGCIGTASAHAGVSRRMHLKWKAKDKSFFVAWEEALSIALDTVEHEARRRAVDGTLEPVYYQGKAVGAIRKYSDTLLIFLLKAMRPEKYRENSQLTLSGGGSTHFYLPDNGRDTDEIRKELHRKLERLAQSQNVTPATPAAG